MCSRSLNACVNRLAVRRSEFAVAIQFGEKTRPSEQFEKADAEVKGR